jgi:hypothetical protein
LYQKLIDSNINPSNIQTEKLTDPNPEKPTDPDPEKPKEIQKPKDQRNPNP